ncbi:MAG: c-type cytochrome biogenesis protein CcsB [Deltaproteobacteria bacterium]|nr:c-type cytochrome biogenesis protein CcsB [Deltaproteobacteria bacterium]
MSGLFLYPALLACLAAGALWLGFLLAQREWLCRAGVWVMGLSLVLLTLELAAVLFRAGRLPGANLGEALLLFAWALVAAFLFFYWRYPIKVLGALAAPLAAVAVSGSLILPSQTGTASPLLESFWLSIHIVLAVLGNAALTLAGLGSILYLIQERQLKGKRFGFFYHRLPSLEQLDALNYRCLTLGFPLLTGGIISGSLYAQYTLGRLWSWDPKEVLTLAAWLVYAVLLHERLAVGWRGRRAALLTLSGLVLLVVTFIGAHLWAAGYHSFSSFAQP